MFVQSTFKNDDMKTLGVFELKGYTKEFYIKGKLIGSIKVDECERECYGYTGRIEETIENTIVLSNKKQIKAGTTVVTEVSPICGRIVPILKSKFRASLSLEDNSENK